MDNRHIRKGIMDSWATLYLKSLTEWQRRSRYTWYHIIVLPFMYYVPALQIKEYIIQVTQESMTYTYNIRYQHIHYLVVPELIYNSCPD